MIDLRQRFGVVGTVAPISQRQLLAGMEIFEVETARGRGPRRNDARGAGNQQRGAARAQEFTPGKKSSQDVIRATKEDWRYIGSDGKFTKFPICKVGTFSREAQ
jgi:hypothetical protein